jgi:hypothetical protein
MKLPTSVLFPVLAGPVSSSPVFLDELGDELGHVALERAGHERGAAVRERSARRQRI